MILEVDSVAKSYRQGQSLIEALKRASFSVAEGETVAIVGPSGSGKSTLLSILAGLDRPEKGAVKLSGQNLSSLDEKSLSGFRAKHLGIVFQQFHLMAHFTALENVSLPLELFGDPQAQTKAKAALELVGLADRLHHKPGELSGGECQRVAIARAFVVEPDLLLADEPSGNLDEETGGMVMDLLFDLVAKSKMSMILVTHDEVLANRCDRKLKLQGGILQ